MKYNKEGLEKKGLFCGVFKKGIYVLVFVAFRVNYFGLYRKCDGIKD